MTYQDPPRWYTPFGDDREELAEELEDAKQDTRQAVDAVTEALLNDDVELTEADIEALWSHGDRLSVLARSAHQHMRETEDGDVAEAVEAVESG